MTDPYRYSEDGAPAFATWAAESSPDLEQRLA